MERLQLFDNGTNILPEGIAEALFRFDQFAFVLQYSKPLLINQRGTRVDFLRGADSLHHSLHFAFHVVALVNHVGYVNGSAGLPFIVKDFVEDAEDPDKDQSTPG